MTKTEFTEKEIRTLKTLAQAINESVITKNPTILADLQLVWQRFLGLFKA